MDRIFEWKPDSVMKTIIAEDETEAWEKTHTKIKFFAYLSIEELKNYLVLEEDMDPAWHTPIEEQIENVEIALEKLRKITKYPKTVIKLEDQLKTLKKGKEYSDRPENQQKLALLRQFNAGMPFEEFFEKYSLFLSC